MEKNVVYKVTKSSRTQLSKKEILSGGAKMGRSCEQTGPDGLIRKSVPKKVWISVLRKMTDIKLYMVVVMSEYVRHSLMS